MLLTKPRQLELTIAPTADYRSVLTALAFAVGKNAPTIISGLERTKYISDVEEILTSGGVTFEWQEKQVKIIPGEVKPFIWDTKKIEYDFLRYLFVLAAARRGSRISLPAEVDNNLQMIILALRRFGAELEFHAGEPDVMEVIKPISKQAKYFLKKETAKIVPQLVLAMSMVAGESEISDLFNSDPLDYIYQHFIPDFQRELIVDEPLDELERRLKRKKVKISEYKSRILVANLDVDSETEIKLKPDLEFASYLIAGAIQNKKSKIILKNIVDSDISNSPLVQLKRIGISLRKIEDNNQTVLEIKRTELKPRKISYEQLHAYPDSIGALALASFSAEGTSVIRTSRFTTEREERQRKRICNLIRSFGVKVAEISDGIVLEGTKETNGNKIIINDDPYSTLLAVTATLGAIKSLEINDLTPAEERWGSAFKQLLTHFDK